MIKGDAHLYFVRPPAKIKELRIKVCVPFIFGLRGKP